MRTLCVVLIWFLTASVAADDQRTAFKEQLRSDIGRLKLSQEQIPPFIEVVSTRGLESKALLDEHSEPSKLSMRQKYRLGQQLRALRQRMEEKLEDVLTEEQLSEYRVLLDRRGREWRQAVGI